MQVRVLICAFLVGVACAGPSLRTARAFPLFPGGGTASEVRRVDIDDHKSAPPALESRGARQMPTDLFARGFSPSPCKGLVGAPCSSFRTSIDSFKRCSGWSELLACLGMLPNQTLEPASAAAALADQGQRRYAEESHVLPQRSRCAVRAASDSAPELPDPGRLHHPVPCARGAIDTRSRVRCIAWSRWHDLRSCATLRLPSCGRSAPR